MADLSPAIAIPNKPLMTVARSLLLASGVAAILSFAAGDWIAGLAVLVLWAGWQVLRVDDAPPVLSLAFTFQWTQVASGVFYCGITGREVPAIYRSDYRPMVLIGLGCLVALMLGLKLGMQLHRRRSPHPDARGDVAVDWRALLAFYVISLLAAGAIQEFAWQLPMFTSVILALSFLRLAVLFLIIRRLSRPVFQWPVIMLLLAIEVALGFTGYFAGFREPLIMAVIVLFEVFNPRRASHWIAIAVIAATLMTTSVVWMGVRTTYRRDFESDFLEQSREARLNRVVSLSFEWLSSDQSERAADVDFFIERVWAIYYPALAISRVPSVLPHTDGTILLTAIQHSLTPRLLFPDKPDLPSDSEMVRKYSGVWVAGPEHDTSIAFGYAAESYIDFGVPLMFAPTFLYGLMMGAAFSWFMRVVRHREVAMALVTVVFWLSLYLFERSWNRTLGLSGTLMIYLGLPTILIDRLLVWRDRSRLVEEAPPVAIGADLVRADDPPR